MALVLAGVGGACELVADFGDPKMRQPDAGGSGGSAGTSSVHAGGSGGGGVPCKPGSMMACYSGPAETEGVAKCHGGMMTCNPNGIGYGACEGEVTPKAETCGSPEDEDCSGHDCVKWAQLFGALGDQQAKVVAVDTTGNLLVAGTFSGAIPLPGTTLTAMGTGDLFILKLDPAGKPLWGKSFGAPNTSFFPSAAAVDGAGEVVIYGSVSGPVSFGGPAVGPGLFVTKLSSDGQETMWSKGFTSSLGVNGASGQALAVTAQGDVVIGGHFDGNIDFGKGVLQSTNGFGNGFIAKLASVDGSGQWSRAVCTGNNTCEVRAMAMDITGNLNVATHFKGTISFGAGSGFISVGQQDIGLHLLAPDGTPIIQKQIGAPNAAGSVFGLAADPSGGAVIAGDFSGTIDFGSGNVTAQSVSGNSYVVRYDASQKYGWSQLMIGTDSSIPPHILRVAADGTGNVFLIGRPPFGPFQLAGMTLPQGAGNFLLAKLSSAGTFSWSKQYQEEPAAGLAVMPTGDPVLVGGVFDGLLDFGSGPLTPNSYDVFVARLSQ
jgi:hypothetical protein